ncbi:YgfZ/GcvT domain-containing protein [[Haemophilus] ducreyi]|uniref:CAF17-like 4Fe-4S cluster assembly/insertion protein YgfZ n=1 Tax=Haemophilus ducreyi TaxID=730 RepID=UPI0006555DDF|nr:folate-binding protein YgfZ [[Haemophilus] ducreyi]AKO44913.1 hypothetical protein RZ66_01045 [[Haemophilus] ducreyi]AKO46317.1 hypothetical protein RZ67_01020 [[Haemophilus] ducreyi]AKO47662.1 hypothetical protein RZ68_01040 [[Haemophilus] ducreyi]AKO49043.1 hypothetical protein RZ69_01035 [[Haemophilus] ducreyi]ANF61769.1 hypothetical protein A6037_02915 [[Haemophilus] ducreyi]
MTCECSKMSNSYPNLCVELSDYRLIEIAGVDAASYLQGQLTCDVLKLAIGEHTLTCHCDPKGKIRALFRIYRASEQQFFMIIHNDLLAEALVQLKKYAVFSKVAFTPLTTPLYGVTGHEQLAKISENSTALLLNQAQKRAIIWGEDLVTNSDCSLWDLIDIQDGIPILLKANQFEFIPQAVNLHAIENAISFTKGCYMGQETVARAKYRGVNKRAMFTLVGVFDGQVALPQIAESIEILLSENWRATGRILMSVVHQHSLWLQVVMNKDIETNTRFRVNGIELKMCDLPYSIVEG